MLPVPFISGHTALAGLHSEPPKTGATSGLFFSQAPATTCPFLCLLASADTVFAVSLLLPGQFVTVGLPWLGELRALLLTAPEGRAIPPRLAPCPTAAQPHSSSSRGQRRPGRGFWAQTPCSGLCPLPGSRGGVPWFVAVPPLRQRTRGKDGEPEVCL